MDWSQIVSLASDIALPILTGGLVWATIALWCSTRRYAKATEKMSQSMDQSTEISERLLRMEKISFLGVIFENIHHPHVDMRKMIVNELGSSIVDKVNRSCGKITEELLQELFENDIRDRAKPEA